MQLGSSLATQKTAGNNVGDPVQYTPIVAQCMERKLLFPQVFLVSIDCEKEKKLLMGGTVMWGDASKPCGPNVCINGKPGFNKIQQLAL